MPVRHIYPTAHGCPLRNACDLAALAGLGIGAEPQLGPVVGRDPEAVVTCHGWVDVAADACAVIFFQCGRCLEAG